MTSYTRIHLVRDSLVFQGKLLLDGFRDLVLVPVSIVATVVDLVSGSEPPARSFRSVLRFGKQTERWIGLFSAAERMPGDLDVAEDDSDVEMLNVDGMVEQIERLIVNEYERGGKPASAREAVDRAWRRIDRRRRALKRLRNRDAGDVAGD